MLDSIKKIYDINPFNKMLGEYSSMPVVVVDENPEPPTPPTPPTPTGPDYFYIKNESEGENGLEIYCDFEGEDTLDFEWSIDKETWTAVSLARAERFQHTMALGETLYMRNNTGKWYTYNENMATISVESDCSVGGNINTLLDYEDPDNATLTEGCFCSMFGTMYESLKDCSNLTLPATTLAPYCYDTMFGGTYITTAPALPATTLAEGCYKGMFTWSKITASPVLPATTLADYCYQEMFSGCSDLALVTVNATDISATDCTTDWLADVAATGTFNNNGGATYTADSASGIPTGWTEVVPN